MKSVLIKMKTLSKFMFFTSIVLNLSFNAYSDTSNEPLFAPSDGRVWNTDEIFCSEFRDEVEIVMFDFNNQKSSNRKINEEIKRKSELTDEFLDEDFFKSKEYKKLIKKWKETDDYIKVTLIPMLESRATIYNAFCKDQ